MPEALSNIVGTWESHHKSVQETVRTSSEDEDFHDLIAERYENRSTILTSNLDFSEWGDAFATNKLLGAATIDRLRHAAYRVELDGESFRDPRPMPEPAKPTVAKGGKNSHS